MELDNNVKLWYKSAFFKYLLTLEQSLDIVNSLPISVCEKNLFDVFSQIY